MKLLLEYSQYKASYAPIKIYVKGVSPIFLDKSKSREKELLVRSIINEIYPKFDGNNSFEFDGVVVSGELLNKAQKNIAILCEIVEISKSTSVIRTADDLISFIRENKYDLFSPKGKFFSRIYGRLDKATKSGKVKENESDLLFKEFTKSKGFEIELKAPDSYKEDIKGVDAYFISKGRKYTIQTKTLRSVELIGEFYIVYISGYYTEIKTHYFVAIPDAKSSTNKKYIFKGVNAIKELDESRVFYYKIPKGDLLFVS